MKNLSLIVAGLLLTLSVFSQTTFPVVADHLYVNYTGNIYLVSGARFYEIDKKNNLISEYNLPGNMQIDHCDVVNPLEILLFNKDFNKIYSLNNKLSLIGSPLSPDAMGLDNIKTICSSSMGGFWIFNSDLRQITHYSVSSGKPTITKTLTGIPEYKNDLPNNMIETNNYLLISFPISGILIFSHNGVFIKQFSSTKTQMSFAQGSTAILHDNSNIILLNIDNFSMDTVFKTEKIVDAYLYKDSIIWFDGKNISFENIPDKK